MNKLGGVEYVFALIGGQGSKGLEYGYQTLLYADNLSPPLDKLQFIL